MLNAKLEKKKSKKNGSKVKFQQDEGDLSSQKYKSKAYYINSKSPILPNNESRLWFNIRKYLCCGLSNISILVGCFCLVIMLSMIFKMF